MQKSEESALQLLNCVITFTMQRQKIVFILLQKRKTNSLNEKTAMVWWLWEEIHVQEVVSSNPSVNTRQMEHCCLAKFCKCLERPNINKKKQTLGRFLHKHRSIETNNKTKLKQKRESKAFPRWRDLTFPGGAFSLS